MVSPIHFAADRTPRRSIMPDNIRPDSGRGGVNSVLSPFAQYAREFAVHNDSRTMMYGVIMKLVYVERHNPILFVIATLQLFHGLRITEVLNIKPTDITPSGSLRVASLKNSAPRMITPNFCISYILRCKKNGSELFRGINRHYVYREYKKLGINLHFNSATNNAVTHALRYVYIRNMWDSGIEINTIQKSVGHKSVKNSQRYVNKK